MYLCATAVIMLIVSQECGALTEDGIVIQILDKSFDVLAGRLGLVRRVYCDVSQPIITSLQYEQSSLM